MKNHYVMNAQSQMLWRDTLEGCKEWARRQRHEWLSMGMTPPVYRIFYDSGKEPVHLI